MLSKISALALISSVQAAPTDLPLFCGGTPTSCTGFPQYKTNIPVQTVTNDAAGALSLTPTPYACVRSNRAYTWPVTKDGSFNSIAPAASGTASTIRSFYSTNLGAYAVGPATVTAAADNSGCCPSAEANCLVGAATGGTPSAPYTGVTVTRILKATTGTDSGFGYSTLHNDFLLGATYQKSVDTLGAAQSATNGWCDPQVYTLVANANQDLVSGTGMSGRKKCTYIILAPGGIGAPAFVVKGVSTPTAFTFDLHFAEWKTTDITTMPVSGSASPFYGNYVAGTYPDPISTTAWNTAVLNWNPKTPLPGSIGNVVYWSQIPGDINPGRQLTVDSAILFDSFDSLNNSYASFNNAVASSNSAVAAYNTAVNAEKARVGDFFKAIFDAPTKIPARPCPPSQPGAWNGPRIWYNLTGLTGTAGTDQTNEQNARAGAVANQASGTLKTNSGFLQVSTDSTVFNATTLAITGHVFGRNGQGLNAMPATANAYWSNPAVTGTNRAAGMMVSIFPNDGTQGELTAGQNVTITVKNVAWNDGSYPLNLPAQPAAPAMPVAAMGAKFIAAGLTAATAVAMTLF